MAEISSARTQSVTRSEEPLKAEADERTYNANSGSLDHSLQQLLQMFTHHRSYFTESERCRGATTGRDAALDATLANHVADLQAALDALAQPLR